MDNNSEINWLNVISINEFQNNLNLNLSKEISMVSKLMREKLKPLIFNNLKLSLESLKFDSNVISIAYDMQYHYSNYDYSTLRDDNNGSIEDSLSEIIDAVKDIKKYTKSFYSMYNRRAGYYLYPLIKAFDNLTHLKIFICDFPFEALVNIGKTLPNLNWLELEDVDLVKSTTDIISETDIIFPPKLAILKIFQIQIVTTSLLSDPYEHLFNMNVYPNYYEYFTLPKVLVPSLKRLDFIPKGEENRGIEEFLQVNPNIESLYTHGYNLNITRGLKSLKSLICGDSITFNNIDQDFRLNSITSLTLSTTNFNYSKIISRLSQLCPNLANISIIFIGKTTDFQIVIDEYLAPIFSKLQHLKTLALINPYTDMQGQILDFAKFSQIEKLKIEINWISVLNIKFDKCKSLNQIELINCHFKFIDDFKRNFNQYNNWVFKFSDHTIKGYKI